MGEAKRRGTFEQRKAQAIAEGRVKREKFRLRSAPSTADMLDTGAALGAAIAMLAFRRRFRDATSRQSPAAALRGAKEDQ